MRIVSLNTGNGERFEALMQFVKEERDRTDVFCFQEVLFGSRPDFTPENHARINLFRELRSFLPTFNSHSFLSPPQAVYYKFEELPDGVRPGLASFTREGINVTNHGGFKTYTDVPEGMDYGALLTGNCQWLDIKLSTQHTLTLMHIHGIYQRDTEKTDTPERIAQSKILLEFIKSKSKTVLVGDFNLLPDTISIALLDAGMDNLIERYGITNTRSSLYSKPIRYADYAFVTRDIIVRDFQLPDSLASDHLPLIVDVEI